MSPAEARLKEVPSNMTEAEWSQRVNLAASYRLVALYGWDDLVDTHISARVPGPEHHFLINPYGLMFEEITASSLVKVDLARQPAHRERVPHQPGRLHHPFGDPRGARGRGLRDASPHLGRRRGVELRRGPAAAQPDRATRHPRPRLSRL